jgi:hypothetical protein
VKTHCLGIALLFCITSNPHAAAAAVTSQNPITASDADNNGKNGGGRLTGSVEAGFDSFQEKYTIVDDDTLDSITEFRSRLSLGYMNGTFLKDFFHLEGRTQLGDDSYETTGRLNFTKLLQSSGSSRLGFSGDVTRRTFRDNSSYDFANDYTRLYLYTYLKKAFNNTVSVRLSERFEHQDFDDRTEFDYDYLRNKVTLIGEFDWNLTTYINTGISFTTMSIPDSSEIGYRAYTPVIEFRHDAGMYKRLVLHSSLERRNYTRNTTRSSFWALSTAFLAQWPLTDSYSLSIDDDLEIYNYGVNSDVYFDYAENRSALLLNYNRSWSFRVGAGPTYGVFISDYSREDEYDEFGGKFSLEYNKGTRAWISFAYEPGKRAYSTFAGSGDDAAIFSDYTYHRISAFLNVKLWEGLCVSGLLDYQPEDHEREGDDATATLFSMSVIYVF